MVVKTLIDELDASGGTAGPAAMRVETGSRSLLAAWCLGLMILLAPLFLFSRPHLQDYPNHLSRVEIMRLAGDTALSSHYEILPLRPGNAAFDAFVLAAAQVMTPESGGRLFVLLALVLTATGAWALRRALGGPNDVILLATLPFLYSASFTIGLLPHLIGIAVALHAMALWVLAGRWPWWLRLPVGALSAMLLATLHLYAFGTFALFVVAEAVTRLGAGYSWRRPAFWLHLAGEGMIGLPALIMLASTAGTSDLVGSAALDWSLDKPLRLLWLFGYGPWWVAILTAGFWLAAVSPLMRRGNLIIDPTAKLAAWLMFAAFVLLPRRAGELYEIDWRALTPAVLVALAGTRYALPAPAKIERRILAGLMALMLAMAATLSWLWRSAEAAQADLIAVTEGLKPGSTLFWGMSDPATMDWVGASAPGIYHIASNAVAARHVMVSTTFAIPGQHPVRLRDPYLRKLHYLSAVHLAYAMHQYGLEGIQLADVAARFDHILLYGPAGPKEPLMLPLDRMHLVRTVGAFRLYAVDRSQR